MYSSSHLQYMFHNTPAGEAARQKHQEEQKRKDEEYLAALKKMEVDRKEQETASKYRYIVSKLQSSCHLDESLEAIVLGYGRAVNKELKWFLETEQSKLNELQSKLISDAMTEFKYPNEETAKHGLCVYATGGNKKYLDYYSKTPRLKLIFSAAAAKATSDAANTTTTSTPAPADESKAEPENLHKEGRKIGQEFVERETKLAFIEKLLVYTNNALRRTMSPPR